MTRSSQTALQLGGFLLLAAILLVNTRQLDQVEQRLIALEGKEPRVIEAPTAPVAAPATASELLPWMEADNKGLSRNAGEVLSPHTRRLVTATHVRGGTLRRQFGSDTRNLNLYMNNSTDGTEWARYYNNRLAYRGLENPDLWHPELAISLSTPDGGLTYRIELRKGVKWHKPLVAADSPGAAWFLRDRELVADDVLFALDIIKNEQITARAASLRNYFEALTSYRAIDDHTIELVFKERLTSNLPALLGDVEPMPRWLYQYDEQGHRYDEATWGLKFNEHWYNNKGIGVGPYLFERWEPGTVIEFKANPDYWGESPSFDHIMVYTLKDQQAWVRKFKAKELDYTNLQPEQYRAEIKGKSPPWMGDANVTLSEHPTLSWFYIAWNQARPLFADKRVRRALTMAFDREGLMNNVYNGLGAVISGPFPLQSPCYDQAIKPWPYDLEAARALLTEAGWTDTDSDGVRDKVIDGKKVPFEFTLMIYGSSTEYETIASIYREALLSVGIRMRPDPVEWSTQQKRQQERDFDGYTGAWAADLEPDLMQIWHSSEADSPGSSNYISFRNSDADRIAEGLRRAFDVSERNKLCHEFHALLHEEQPYTFFFQRRTPVVSWSWMNELEYQLENPNRDNRRYSFREARP